MERTFAIGDEVFRPNGELVGRAAEWPGVGMQLGGGWIAVALDDATYPQMGCHVGDVRTRAEIEANRVYERSARRLGAVARWLNAHPDADRIIGLASAFVATMCDDVLEGDGEGPLQFACTPEEFRKETESLPPADRSALRELARAILDADARGA